MIHSPQSRLRHMPRQPVIEASAAKVIQKKNQEESELSSWLQGTPLIGSSPSRSPHERRSEAHGGPRINVDGASETSQEDQVLEEKRQTIFKRMHLQIEAKLNDSRSSCSVSNASSRSQRSVKQLNLDVSPSGNRFMYSADLFVLLSSSSSRKSCRGRRRSARNATTITCINS